jgi:hypothetical protein
MADQFESARRYPVDFHLGWMAARALQTFLSSDLYTMPISLGNQAPVWILFPA